MEAITRPTILVVEDEQATRRAVCRLLDRHGYHALGAPDVRTALEELTEQVGGIVTDYGLGETDGLTMLATIAETRPELPAVMITGNPDPDLAERAFRQGVGGFLRKPFLPQEFLATLREVVGPGAIDPAEEKAPTSEGSRPEYDRDSGIFRGVRVPDRSETLSMIAHDIRSSLMTVLVATEELRCHTDLDERQRRLLRIAQRNARQLEALAGELSELGAAGSGKLTLDRELLDLTEVISASLDMAFRPDQTLHLVSRLEPGIQAYVDPSRLARAVGNVVGNALRFASKEVALTLDLRGDYARFTVEDDGPGIPEDVLPSAFQPFVRGDRQGTGLGLAITREIVRAHGGRVTAMNRPDGAGAKFELWLPVASAAEANA